jgi:hypothetical protein
MERLAIVIGNVVMAGCAVLILTTIIVFATTAAVALWNCIIWRKPHHVLRISTIDRFVTTGDGKPIKRAPDLNVSRAYCFGWRRKFLFGLLVFEDDRS